MKARHARSSKATRVAKAAATLITLAALAYGGYAVTSHATFHQARTPVAEQSQAPRHATTLPVIHQRQHYPRPVIAPAVRLALHVRHVRHLWHLHALHVKHLAHLDRVRAERLLE